MLEGVLVDLVPFGDTYTSRMRDWLNGPMREWWGMDGLVSQAGYQRQQDEMREQADQGRFVRFGVQTKTGVPIGMFGIFDINPASRMAEVGAGIGNPDYWGGGYGSDAMLLITEYAFSWLDLRRLWLHTRGDNFRAQRQVEKCGYTYEGRHRAFGYQHTRYYDFVIYGLLREEWPGLDTMVTRLGLRDKARARGLNGEN